MKNVVEILIGARDATGAAWKSAQSKAERLKRKMKTAFAGIGKAINQAKIGIALFAAAIGAAVRKVVNFASEIRHVSDNLEISAETLQALNATALKYGMTIGDLSKSLAKLRQSQGKVIEGDKEYQDAVEALNIDLEAFKKASPAEALELLARAYAGAEDRALAYSAVSDLMGRGAKKATAFMKELADVGLAGVEAAAKSAGHVIEDDLITKLELFGTRMELIGLRMKVFGAKVGNAIYEGFDALTDVIGKGIGGASMDEILGGIDAKQNPVKPVDPSAGVTDTNISDRKAEQSKLEDEVAKNDRMMRDRMGDLEKLKAEYEATEQSIIAEIASTPSDNQDLRRVLFDRVKILEESYLKEIEVIKSAAEEKEALEDDIAKQEKDRHKDKIDTLKAQAADLQKQLNDDAANRANQLALAGAELNLAGVEKEAAKHARRQAMTVRERRDAEKADRDTARENARNIDKEMRLREKLEKGARLGKGERDFLKGRDLMGQVGQAKDAVAAAQAKIERDAILKAEQQRKDMVAKLDAINAALATNLKAA